MESDKNTNTAAQNPEDTNKTVISLNGPVIANPVVSFRPEGDEGALLFNPDTDSTLLINPTGILVWNFISKPRTIEEIIDYITKMFNNPPDHASLRTDIVTFVTDLVPDFIAEV